MLEGRIKKDMMKLLVLITLLSVQIESFPQTPTQQSSVVGTVAVVEKTAKTISIKTDQNATLAIKVERLDRLFACTGGSAVARQGHDDSL